MWRTMCMSCSTNRTVTRSLAKAALMVSMSILFESALAFLGLPSLAAERSRSAAETNDKSKLPLAPAGLW